MYVQRMMFTARRGFTLIEIMIVVLIIGILVTFASFSYRHLRQRVQRVSCRENLRILQQAAVLCQTEHAELDNNDLTPGRLFQLGYLKKVLRCPAGGQYAITQEKGYIEASCFKTLDGTDHGSFK
ncbi:MAG TPA: prepilin-type N-terminal cleavage/methylation domain-containing protein [Candidatus Ozemobacteraceae bacterium]|nr:prepilin-type N-terminal cleavage/methylation domain-containing protein [Candidatus Ozemobacteraceae bacterium]